MTIEDVWYGQSPVARWARTMLQPLSAVYGAAALLRSVLYDRGIRVAERAPAPVVSVGGLSVGGSGKTPFVLWLATRLRDQGLRPCIVTRGYRGSGQPCLLGRGDVPEAARELDDLLRRAGDEAALLLLRSGCSVAIGSDRVRACRSAADELARRGEPADLFLLDDGFQHRRLARDLDIVLLGDGDIGRGLLPGGPLREGPAALARADVVVEAGAASSAKARGHRADALRLRVRFEPSLLVRSVTDQAGDDPAMLAGRRVVAVAAIARPQRFLDHLRAAGADVVATLLRRDHHWYDATDRRAIEEAASAADLVVTTEKDLVKLAGCDLGGRLRALRIDVCVEGEQALLERVHLTLRPSHA